MLYRQAEQEHVIEKKSIQIAFVPLFYSTSKNVTNKKEQENTALSLFDLFLFFY